MSPAAGRASEAGADRTLAPFGRRATRVVANEASGSYRLISAADEAGPLPPAGQFYMLAAGSAGAATAAARGCPAPSRSPRPSRSARRAASGSRSCSRTSGPGTAALARLGEGEELLLTGPLGRPFSAPRELNPDAAGAILVGGGIGLAPLAILRRSLAGEGVPQRSLLGFRDRDHAGGMELFRCSDVGLASEDGHVGHRGYVTDLLERMLEGDQARSAAVYSCGPPAMLEAVRLMCEQRSVPCELALESPMACGFGACFGCAVPLAAGGYMRLCVDGPVVRGEEIATAMLAGSGHR